MYVFLELLSSGMLFWNDPHHACLRKAYMMRVIPEKHT
jgi:hypothetical protein